MSNTVQIACAACGYAAELAGADTKLPEALQCPMCGTWIRDLAAEVEAASRTAPESDDADAAGEIAGYLVAASSKSLDEQYPLRGSRVVVGREGADVNIADPTMSMHHFEIEKRGGEFFIRDLGSTNQTRVNGQKIETITLRPGDRIQAGLTCLVFLAA